jgi:hypothetical protein
MLLAIDPDASSENNGPLTTAIEKLLKRYGTTGG